MSPFTVPALLLEPHFSNQLAGVLTILYSGALIGLWPLRLLVTVKVWLALLILLSAIPTVRRHVLLINHPLSGCVLCKDSVWLSTEQQANILPSTYIHPQLVVLNVLLVKSQKTYFLILFPDALDRQTFRRLRVRLRHVMRDV